MNKAQVRIIEPDDIQLLRYWRNKEHVRKQLLTTNFIDRDGQRAWFEQLDKETQQYFIFSIGSQDIGVTSLSNINHDDKSFEAGVFCGDQNFLSHWINVWACIKLYDFAFDELGLKVSYAEILNKNTMALNLNKSLGYEYFGNVNQSANRYFLNQNSYIEKSAKIKRYLEKFVGQSF